MIAEAFDAHSKKDGRADSDTPWKIENTIAFHHFCQQQAKEEQERLKRLDEALDIAVKKSD